MIRIVKQMVDFFFIMSIIVFKYLYILKYLCKYLCLK